MFLYVQIKVNPKWQYKVHKILGFLSLKGLTTHGTSLQYIDFAGDEEQQQNYLHYDLLKKEVVCMIVYTFIIKTMVLYNAVSVHVQQKFFSNTFYSGEEKFTVKESNFHTSVSRKSNKACAQTPTYQSRSIVDKQNTILGCCCQPLAVG